MVLCRESEVVASAYARAISDGWGIGRCIHDIGARSLPAWGAKPTRADVMVCDVLWGVSTTVCKGGSRVGTPQIGLR